MTAIEVWRVATGTDGGFGAALDPGERERARRFAFADDRDRFVLRRGVRRALLAGRDASWFWSASSTPGEVVVALARGTAVGVDVERRRGDRANLYARVCTPAEQAALRRAGAGAGALFHTLWTRKEAVLKLLGVGLARPPANVDALVPATRAFATLAAPEPVWVRDLPGTPFAALACARRPDRVRIVRATAVAGVLKPLGEEVVDGG
jgi:phosphopantetheinyl transferase